MAKAVKKTTRRRKTPSGPVGLTPREVCTSPPKAVEELCREIQADGGAVIAPYRDPLGGHWLVLAALPLEQVEPTPYQRKVSDAHVKRLSDVIARTGRFLDPVIAVRVGPKQYQTPNGGHRTGALKLQGARSITALVVTEPEVARLILALNVEKAHNLREKSLEVIRLARELAAITAGARCRQRDRPHRRHGDRPRHRRARRRIHARIRRARLPHPWSMLRRQRPLRRRRLSPDPQARRRIPASALAEGA